MYQLANVKKYYHDLLALSLENINFQKNKIYVVYGPNASGKTTLLKLLGFLDYPQQGTVTFDGNRFSIKNPITARQRKKVTFVSQNPYLFRSNVFENLSFGLKLRGINRVEAKSRIYDALKILGLSGFEKRHVSTLSGGESQRVALARALCLDTDVLLLDEPATYIDKAYVRIIEQSILEQKKADKTVIMTTHDISQALRMANTVYYLAGGKLTTVPLHNVFVADIYYKGGHKLAALSENIEIYLVANKPEKNAKISIDPRKIIVSIENVNTSARNVLPGKIISISEGDNLVELKVDVGVNFHSVVTRESFDEMKLNIGKKVFLIFKANSVEVL